MAAQTFEKQANSMNKWLIMRKIYCSIAASIYLLAFAAAVEAAEPENFVPNFFDPKIRLEAPDISSIRAIRFMSDDDYPPFHFIAQDGQLTGFNIELARLICEELKLACTIQARRWDTLIDSLEQSRGDAIIASLANTPALRQRVSFTASYYRTPARFVADKTSGFTNASPDTLSGKTVGIVSGSAHEEYLKRFFPGIIRRSFTDMDALRAGLRRKQVELIFGDAVALSFWLNGKEADGCCGFVGGPFTESRFFGDGVGIAVRKEDETLRRALDYALARLARNGTYTTLYLKYFPIGFY